MQLILASASPRRKELLALLCKDFKVEPAIGAEVLPLGISPYEAVKLLSEQKAAEIFAHHRDDLVLGADTVVEIDGLILGKPRDTADALRMLSLLSGRTHLVHTGICLINKAERRSLVSTTRVTFSVMTEQEQAAYANTPEPYDKAGGYGIQGIGARFVSGICGDYYTVMGLPVAGLYQILTSAGFTCDFN